MNEAVDVEDGPGVQGPGTARAARLVVFRCANGLPPGGAPPPAVGWPRDAHEIAVPCTGRLQPEHLLKVFEAGADAVCVLACAEDNCHYLEGSQRARRRAEYVRGLLGEVGLRGERLMTFHLPGSAREEMMLGWARGDRSPPAQVDEEELTSRLAAIRSEVTAKLDALEPSPLRRDGGGQ